MASLFKKPGSPYWYVRFKSKDKKYPVKASTGYFHTHVDKKISQEDTLKARELRAQMEAKELAATGRKKHSIGWDWVDPFFIQTLKSPLSLVRYRNCWEWVLRWLDEKHIGPETVQYAHAQEYLEWRTPMKRRSGKTPARNTILLEIRVWTNVMTEAARRGHIQGNPFFRLRLVKGKIKKKREIQDKEFKTISEAMAKLPAEDAWMSEAWMIGKFTGCRLSETQIPLELIDLESDPPVMTWPAPKGGEEKSFSAVIPSALMPLFRKMKAEGRNHTLKLPFQSSRKLGNFIRSLGIKDITFHNLRVTRITRLRRAGVERESAMRMVNHSNELVHTAYDRHQVRDLAKYRDVGQAPDDSDAT